MESELAVRCQQNGTVNFAMQQNHVPVIRNITITNNTDRVVENAVVQITASPAFAADYTVTIARLMPHVPVELSPVRLILSPEYLLGLTEQLTALLHIKVSSGERELYSADEEITLLACDAWPGITCMPELIASFVTPNHPQIAAMTAKAAVYLSKWTGDPAFTGYQTKNPDVVRSQIAAIYAALQEEGLAYTVPIASYEALGQRVRLPQTVIAQKAGTCLDLAVLFASCLEAVGLHPMLLFVKGHAFAACWLEEENFPECVIDDCAALTKRIAAGIDLLCVVECTDFAAGRSVPFDRAQQTAAAHLQDADSFLLGVDISRCRSGGIRPMPCRADETFSSVDYGTPAPEISAPQEMDLTRRTVVCQEDAVVTRQTLWERKLLDLSLRNRLLNFRPNAASVQLMTADLPRLEDALADGEAFRIMAVPEDFSPVLSDKKIYEIDSVRDTVQNLCESEFRNHRLRSFLSDTELERTMKKLHREAKVSIEENGANTMYLALGFLRWYETERSASPRYAPLVLVPVDIVRSIQDRAYKIRVRGEETQMNVTLLEMLRQDFGLTIGGLNPLPEDEHGIDLPLVFHTVRQGIMEQKRWDIEELAFLGQFSFSQFIMWNDIRNRSEELRQNKVVASLISGKAEWTPEPPAGDPLELDQTVAPCDMAVPMSADSSQLSAIYEAARGQSFVLHGPPGTGKSQTITNLIANALYQGKSVLFVAEKMAALSVVQKRLSRIGLAPFCLELHSNKAQKRAVLQQLDEALAVGRIKSPETYQATADRLFRLRSELNDTIAQLHEPRALGLSLYEAITLYERNKRFAEVMSLQPERVSGADRETYQNWQDLIRSAAAAGEACGGLCGTPLESYENTEYSLSIRDSFGKSAEEFSAAVTNLRDAWETAQQKLGCTLPSDYAGYCAVRNALLHAADCPALLPAVLEDADLEAKLGVLNQLLESGKEYQSLRAELDAGFEPGVREYDAASAALAWKEAEQSWFLPKAIKQGKLLKTMRLYKKTGSVEKEQMPGIYEKLARFRRLETEIRGADAGLTARFGGRWFGVDSAFETLSQALLQNAQLRTELQALPGDRITLRAAICAIPDAPLHTEAIRAVQTADESTARLLETLVQKYRVRADALTAGDCWMDTAKSAADGFAADLSRLKERTVLTNCLDALEQAGLGAAVTAYRTGSVREQDLLPAFLCAASRALIHAVLDSVPVLAKFQGAQFEDTITKFRETSEEFERLTMQELAARLSAQIPDTSASSASSSEVSILRKAIRSGGRMLPIRKLFDSIPNLLRRMCPCMLMSPISVAQYIDPSFPKFDLVVFDEASQLPTSEAVGAIARGENVIVVGDPNQLPPTSFFSANQTDEEHFDQEDLESVLDDCLALAMPQKHLLWHYRSRHESLIAYSNAKYYDNKLLTFPSPDDRVSEVKWIPVDGFYDKGGTKQCRAEAEAIVAEIRRRLLDETLRRQSIGVVTFSVVQQVLIDDLIAEAFRKEPELERYANEMHEPILVKNLENVQGDERDVILFSVGYGPDKNGNVSMNFGPLNRDGGWRRLNVAISRSRMGMQVYSVLRPEQINLSRTRSEGVAGLKGFLEFAAKGKSALAVRAQDIAAEENGYNALVAEALEQRGYQVGCEIGCSAYKIDIGIINPEQPDRYILGILCDGRKHFEATNARDRNLLQPSILKGLGWNVFSLRILDWLDHPEQVLRQIDAAYEAAMVKYREHPDNIRTEAQPAAAEPIQFERAEQTAIADTCQIYEPYQPKVHGDAEMFYLPQEQRNIIRTVQAILAKEAPVSRKAAQHLLLASYGITRSSAKTEQIFAAALSAAGAVEQETENGVFLWRADQPVDSYSDCRIPAEGGARRAMDEICPEEIANAAEKIVTRQVSLQREDLIREIARLFGYPRVGDVIEAAAETGIRLALARGTILSEEEGRVSAAK